MNGMSCRAGKDLDDLPARQSFLPKKTPHKREDARYLAYLACYEKVICKPMAGSHLIYSMLEL